MINKFFSLRAKLIIAFLFVGGFFLGAFLLLQIQLIQFNKNVNEKLSNIDSLFFVTDEIRSSLSIAIGEVNLIDSAEKLEAVSDLEAGFNNEIIDYNLYSKALLYGSESKEFKEIDSGITYEQWKNKGYSNKLIIYKPDKKQADNINKALNKFNDFVKISSQIFALKKEELSYRRENNLKKVQETENEIKSQEVILETTKGDLSEDIEIFTEEIIAGVRQSTDRIGSSTLEVRNKSYIYFSLAFIAIIVCFIFIRRFIIFPIKELSQAAGEILEGRAINKARVFNKDEVGVLASVFNHMIDKLNVSRGSLEQKIQEKTIELSSKITDLEDAKRAMMNIMQDIQVEKEKINEQKIILDSILTNLPVGVSLSLTDGRIMMINRSGTRVLGRVIDPNTTKDNFTEIYRLCKHDGTPYPSDEIPFNIVLKEGKACTKDDIYVNKQDGITAILRITCVPIRNAKNQIASIVSLFEDITHDKDVDRMKTEFISLASHQLRTPLSAIKWFSEMLIGGDAGELSVEQKDFAKNIVDSTKRMIDLVNSLLNISRIESGRIIVDSQPTDLKELLSGIVNELQVKVQKKHQNLVVSVHDKLPIINLDPKLIRQVYLNFLTNAIKYSPVGGEVSVFVSLKDNEVISQITDSGYGIPKAEQYKMFQKFFRATNVAKIETDGTGLGLYLVKAIIESSKGKVWFQSEEGKGTTFWFSLPITGMVAREGEVSLDS